ncbi:ribonuclease HII [Reichenbachiella versicolor]|uniref:ribonuclease HII n=1 Tax=Reichenbachiella versicolor TaxID=1821036 RepID=UPI000D6E380B|nr:ribonuclease HII [Reichenbachiella versicolor]
MGLLSYFKEGKIEAGCDEAGRGCLAGPVVAAAVILPPDYTHDILNDSKKLNAKQREELRKEVENESITYGVGIVSNEEIDEINILNASFLAMHRAIAQLEQIPELLLIDGNRFNQYRDIPHETIIKGDGKYYAIAAASILAKTYRDEIMKGLDKEYEGYGWATNAGYPTKAHRKAIKELGVTPYHRLSFRLLPEQLEMF